MFIHSYYDDYWIWRHDLHYSSSGERAENCKFPTEEFTGAESCNFFTKLFQNEGFSPKFFILNENWPTGKKFPTVYFLRGRGEEIARSFCLLPSATTLTHPCLLHIIRLFSRSWLRCEISSTSPNEINNAAVATSSPARGKARQGTVRYDGAGGRKDSVAYSQKCELGAFLSYPFPLPISFLPFLSFEKYVN